MSFTRRPFCRTWLVVLLLTATSSAVGSDEDLKRHLMPLIDAHSGDVAVSIKHLENGEAFQFQQDMVMPTASLIKLPVMIEAYRQIHEGQLQAELLIDVRQEDKVPGSGILTKHFGEGSKLTLRDAIRLMIAYSDNTATNLVIDQIGLAATSATMQRMGFPETQLHSRVYRGSESIMPERSRLYGLGSTTADDIVALLERLHHRDLISEAASDSMLEHLRSCESRSQLPRLLPQGVMVAHKSGSVANSRCDAGIIYSDSGPIAICVLTNNNQDRRWSDDNAAELLCARIAKTTFDHFNPSDRTSSAAATTLQIGEFGRLVESVQRTLNARLQPSPELSIDGDFGPATKTAVVAFQSAHGITATGVVEADTWQALSPLITERHPVPDPDTVSNEQLPLLAADPLDGRPFVSCKAWAVADATTGELLGGSNMERRLDIASTTKVMTAWLILRLAETQPDIMDEVVTFSPRADGTRGSTSGVEAGESLPVAELLYGLLLPSGNDAAVALAECFGKRLSTAEQGENDVSADPLDLFVACMNDSAVRLDMVNTVFQNPHGLTEAGHHSSPADLVKLVHAALKLPAFRKYIATRQRGCTVTGAGGYTRHILWKNTNRLLPITGYAGVKTGTTSEAGACLISLSVRDDKELVLVVLGAASSTGRYVDSRNLFRWAWQQLQDE